MQKKRLFLVFMISCICLLPLDAGAQAGAVGKILKNTAKAAKSRSYGFSRAGIAAKEFEKHNRLNRNYDSIYWDSSKNRPMYMESLIKMDSLNENQFSNQRRFRDFAPYAESAIKDNSVAEDSGFTSDSVVQIFETDSLKTTEDTNGKANKSTVKSTYYSNESDNTVWKLSLGLIIFIALIICCSLKFFGKKRGLK